jgi:RimJ/RimL family protein N-acetyltransferase
LIGYVQATVRDREADVAWVIGADWQGHGYGTEASTLMLGQLKQVGIQSITSQIHSANSASLGIARNLGMNRNGLVQDGEEVWELQSVHSTDE